MRAPSDSGDGKPLASGNGSGERAALGEQPPWADWDDEALLDLRLCDLKLGIRGSAVDDRVRQLYAELEARGLSFRPHFWLSTEWFCPDGVAGVAIPFFLAHPRLIRLEESRVIEAEGSDPHHCMQLLRHEVGHAIDNAYGLRRRKRRQELFGSASQPYSDDYAPRPYSRKFVRHLPGWYSQSHPVEDFAETFAVWLDPGSDWRRQYAGWPVLAKLEYLNELMAEIAAGPKPELDRSRVEPLRELRTTLRQYYADKQERYGVGDDVAWERELGKIFSASPRYADRPEAAAFLREMRRPVRKVVARWTGVYQYTIDQLYDEIVKRCRERSLRLKVPDEQARLDITIAVAVHTMKYVHSERNRFIR